MSPLRTRPSFTLSQLLLFRTGIRPVNRNNTRTFSVSATPRDSSSGVPKTKGEAQDSSLPAKTEPSKQRPPFESASLYRLTVPPNPDWKPGEGFAASAGAQEWMQGEEEGYLSLDTAKMSPKELYPLMISGIVPRPIAFVSSLSAEGVPNLAPFSIHAQLLFNVQNGLRRLLTHYYSTKSHSQVSHNPPLISISFIHPKHKEKDTSENIRATKEFTVNIISEPFVTNANYTSIDAPADFDEWIGSGLTREPSTIVKPPRVKESAFSMECELYHLHDLSPPGSSRVTGTLMVGHVKMIHVRNKVLSEKGVVKPSELRAVSRMGGKLYGRIGQCFELPTIRWEK